MDTTGKCLELSTELSQKTGHRLVRGYYHCPIWGKRQHWWCVDDTGEIHDPTKDQFPSGGLGEYEEFDGYVECAECGRRIRESDVVPMGRYGCCSDRCACRLVGI